MRQHEENGRRYRLWVVGAAGALCLTLLGCGDDSTASDAGDTSSATTVDVESATTTTGQDDGTENTIVPPELIGEGDPETCAAIEAVNAADYEDAVVAARDIDPPAELADVWDDFLDARGSFGEADVPDEDMERYATAIGVVGAYAVSYCPLG